MIYKETEIKNPFYITILNNGVTLFVYDGWQWRVCHCNHRSNRS